ncbi:hypothetical protein SM114_00805 [Erwinia pyrifoliae]
MNQQVFHFSQPQTVNLELVITPARYLADLTPGKAHFTRFTAPCRRRSLTIVCTWNDNLRVCVGISSSVCPRMSMRQPVRRARCFRSTSIYSDNLAAMRDA